MKYKLVLATDHRGFKLKEFLKQYINNNMSNKFELVDVGAFSEESVDYPIVTESMAEELKNNPDARGILICGSGIGVCIAANRYKFIRAVSVYSEYTARMSREHNDANVICLASDLIEKEDAEKYINLFLTSNFTGGHHQARVDQLAKLGE